MRAPKGRWLVVAVLVGAALTCAALAQEPEFALGGGGPSVGLAMPNLTEINEFVEGAEFEPFDGNLLLIGGGGRGGLVPGPAFGGAGWGAGIESQRGNLHAEYATGLGGLDMGFAIGGTDRSVLAIGAVIGGGAAELILTEEPVATSDGVSLLGIVVEPAQWTYDSAFAFFAPYADAQIQLLDWMGLSVRAGYLLPLFEVIWSGDQSLDLPDLAPFGAYVRFTIAFGAITDLRP